MKTDTDLERLLRDALRQELDGEYGPDPAWDESPAARRVAAPVRRGPRRGVLRLMGVAALVTIGVGTALVVGAPEAPPAASRNGWIAYGMQPEEGGDADIWFVSLQAEPRRAVGSDTDNVDQLCPAFSPDGRSLAYGEVDRAAATPSTAVVVAAVSGDGEVSEPFRVDVGDTPPCPVWSPTGDRIAFGVPLTSVTNPERGAAGSEVWILTVADRSITVLPDLLATDLEFSPDGSRLAVASGGDDLLAGNQLHDGRIHLYELDSGATRILEDTRGALTFTWSPDGGRIAYQRIADGSSDSQVELLVIDLATDEQRPLSAGPFARFGAIHGIGPVWSPNGESILYQRCRPAVTCSGEDHDIVIVWPDDLSPDGNPREAVLPFSEQLADGSERRLKGPYWVTWSPDGEYLLFAGWSIDIDPLLGVVSAAPGSSATVLVTAQDVSTNPVYQFGPFVPMQSWGRLPAGAVMPTTVPEPSGPETTPSSSAAGAVPSPSAWVGLPAGPVTLATGTTDTVPVAASIAAPLWGGEPDSGFLCKIGSAGSCAPSPDGARLFVFAGREYDVYGEACQWSTTRPENPATSVDEFIDALALQGSRDESAPEDISLGRYDGKRIVLRMHPIEFDACDDGHPALFGPAGADPVRRSERQDQIEEVWAVDVNGVMVVLVGTYYPDTPLEVIEELRAILASATFD